MKQPLSRRALRLRAHSARPADLGRAAWVVSPHPDDETLGCGGVIARKCRAGASVSVVFVSDGEASHAWIEGAAAVSARRCEEARSACERLGVRRDNVHFLHLPDGHLANHVNAGTRLLAELFRQQPASELFLPYRYEPPPDHRAAQGMAREAARQAGLKGTSYEYPVWFWSQWPWSPWSITTARSRGGISGRLRRLKPVLRDLGHAVRDLDWAVDIRDVLDVKQHALSAHRSQMERIGGPQWPVLADVHQGHFLRNLLYDHEFFHRDELA